MTQPTRKRGLTNTQRSTAYPTLQPRMNIGLPQLPATPTQVRTYGVQQSMLGIPTSDPLNVDIAGSEIENQRKQENNRLRQSMGLPPLPVDDVSRRQAFFTPQASRPVAGPPVPTGYQQAYQSPNRQTPMESANAVAGLFGPVNPPWPQPPAQMGVNPFALPQPSGNMQSAAQSPQPQPQPQPQGLPAQQVGPQYVTLPPAPQQPMMQPGGQSSAAQPMGSVDYQQGVYQNAYQNALREATAPVQANMDAYAQRTADRQNMVGFEREPTQPQLPPEVDAQIRGASPLVQQAAALNPSYGPSGIPWTPQDAARNANMAQGTPWQFTPGTVGLPVRTDEMIRQEQMGDLSNRLGLPSDATRDQRLGAAGQRMEDMYASADPTLLEDRKSAKTKGPAQREAARARVESGIAAAGGLDAQMAQRRAGRRERMQGENEAAGTANYARNNGLPVDLASAALGRSTLSDQERAMYGIRPEMPTPEDQMQVARMNAIATALQGLGAGAAPVTPEMLQSIIAGIGATGNGLPQPTEPPTSPAEVAAVAADQPEKAEEIRTRITTAAAVRPRLKPAYTAAFDAAIDGEDWAAVQNLLSASGVQGDELLAIMNSLRGGRVARYTPTNPKGTYTGTLRDSMRNIPPHLMR